MFNVKNTIYDLARVLYRDTDLEADELCEHLFDMLKYTLEENDGNPN